MVGVSLRVKSKHVRCRCPNPTGSTTFQTAAIVLGWSFKDRPSWSEEWREIGLGADLVDGSLPQHLFFVQLGFGVDQHGENNATKASIRAFRNAIEFNSIPGVISQLPGGRNEMLIHVKLLVPGDASSSGATFPVDVLLVAKVFPYGKLLPLHIGVGGLSFHTGRSVVEELGDENDVGIV